MKKKKSKVVAVSGGFDPLHIGHIRYLKEAQKLGDSLVVILNNDHWLRAKKGFVFMPEKERAELVRAVAGVDKVILTSHKLHDSDRSVSRELRKLKPAVFANGGDRTSMAETPEAEVCKKHGIQMVFGVGRGGKVQSSSWLVKKVPLSTKVDVRPWGSMQTFTHQNGYWVKGISVSPGRRLSLQSHRFRSEHWVCVDGSVEVEINGKYRRLQVGDSAAFGPLTRHRLSSKSGGTIVEIGFGAKVDESDIVRHEDDYGRV